MAHNSNTGVVVQASHQDGEGEYITLQQLAVWLNISRGTAWSIVMERGDIPYLRLSDRVVRVARADVEGVPSEVPVRHRKVASRQSIGSHKE